MNEEKSETIASADRGDEKNDGSGKSTSSRRAGKQQSASDEQRSERKTNRQKRGELHQVLAQVVDREARQQRLRNGTATEDDARKEGDAIEEEARARSGRIRAGQTAHI